MSSPINGQLKDEITLLLLFKQDAYSHIKASNHQSVNSIPEKEKKAKITTRIHENNDNSNVSRK